MSVERVIEALQAVKSCCLLQFLEPELLLRGCVIEHLLACVGIKELFSESELSFLTVQQTYSTVMLG
jgi:hypothetical protein